MAGRSRDLEEVEVPLEHLVAAGPVVMFTGTVAPEGDDALCLDYVSPNCTRVLGRDPDAFRSAAGLTAVVHTDDGARLLAAARRAARGDSPPGTEVRLRGVDGSWRWAELTLRPRPGRTDGVLGYVVDVTARRRAETAQRESASHLAALVDNSSAMISLKDPFGRYQFVNRALAELMGTSSDRAVGTDDFEHWPEAAPALRAHDQQVLVGRRSMLFEEVVPGPDGPHTFVAQRFPLLDDEGMPIAVGTVATDVTELTRAMSTLAARERVLSTVIAASPDVISILEEDGTIRTTSVAFERIFGHPTRALVDRCLFDVVHPDDVPAAREGFARLREEEAGRVTLRFRAQRADGQWVTIESHAQVMVDEAGRHDGVVMVSRDVSDQIAMEAALRNAKEHAEHASNAKSEFLSRVSHELRTPLNAMLGFAQLLELEELDDPGTEFVDQILRAGDHLLSLINEVLDIARIETDHLNLHLEPVHARDAVREVVGLAGPLAARAGIDLPSPEAVHVPADAVALADRQRLLQVLLNLVSNAIKYNHPGGRVGLAVEVAPDGRVRLCVADTGPGLSPEQIDRLFVPFDRLGLEHTGIEGTGVGLALSRGLAERMGGTLGVRSAPGEGSTFWIDLPGVDAAAAASTLAPSLPTALAGDAP